MWCTRRLSTFLTYYAKDEVGQINIKTFRVYLACLIKRQPPDPKRYSDTSQFRRHTMSNNIAHPRKTAVLDTVAKFFHVMDKEGAPLETFHRPLQNREARQNLARFLRAGCPFFNDTGDHSIRSQSDVARFLLGDDFITPDAITCVTGITYSDKQRKKLFSCLPNRKDIAWCLANNCILLPSPPEAMSLEQIRDRRRELFCGGKDGLYSDQRLMENEKTEAAKWFAFRMCGAPDSRDRTWKEQFSLAVGVELVPNVAEVCWALIVYREVRNIYLLSTTLLRTSSIDSRGTRACVGNFYSDSLSILGLTDNHKSFNLGVAAARKLFRVP